MKKQFKIFVIIAIMLNYSCSTSDDNTTTGTGEGEVTIQASYRVTFEPNFVEQFHPNDYPNDATFIKPFIVAHSSATSIFKLGSFASSGLKLYTEDGDSSELVTEHTQVEDNVKPTTIVQGTSDVGPIEAKVYTINVTPDKTLISFITKISPSPDWFLGVDSFDIVKSDNTLVESISFELFAHDAGTEDGDTYISANVSENKAIVLRTGLPLSNTANETGKSLGKLTIERINNN